MGRNRLSQIGHINFQVFTKPSTIMDMKDIVLGSGFLSKLPVFKWDLVEELAKLAIFIQQVHIPCTNTRVVVHNREIPCLKFLSKNKLTYSTVSVTLCSVYACKLFSAAVLTNYVDNFYCYIFAQFS